MQLVHSKNGAWCGIYTVILHITITDLVGVAASWLRSQLADSSAVPVYVPTLFTCISQSL